MTTPTRNTLSKNERIYKNKHVDQLFASKESFIAYPLRIVYRKREKNEEPDVAMLVSVPKRRFKRAVKRNRIKRLVREAFRLNKQLFVDITNNYSIGLDIAFLCVTDELPTFKDIENAIFKTARVLNEKLNEAKPSE